MKPYLALRSYLPADDPNKAQEIGSEPTLVFPLRASADQDGDDVNTSEPMPEQIHCIKHVYMVFHCGRCHAAVRNRLGDEKYKAWVDGIYQRGR